MFAELDLVVPFKEPANSRLDTEIISSQMEKGLWRTNVHKAENELISSPWRKTR